MQLVNMGPWLHGGSTLYRLWLREYHRCRVSNKWPGLPPIRESHPTKWYLNDIEAAELQLLAQDKEEGTDSSPF